MCFLLLDSAVCALCERGSEGGIGEGADKRGGSEDDPREMANCYLVRTTCHTLCALYEVCVCVCTHRSAGWARMGWRCWCRCGKAPTLTLCLQSWWRASPAAGGALGHGPAACRCVGLGRQYGSMQVRGAGAAVW